MRERVKIVYFINSLGVGGAEVGMCRLLNGLEESRYDITVIVLDDQTELIDQIPAWVNVIRLQSFIRGHLTLGWEIFQSIRNADIIVGSLYHAAMTAKFMGLLKPNAKIATWRHNTAFKTQTRERTFKWTSKLTDVVLADSKAVAKTLIRDLQIDDSVVHTVPIAGINLNDYTQAKHDKKDTITVGTVGNLIEQKNHTTILDVAEQLQESSIQFEIAGDGKLREQLESERSQRELSNVTFHGFVDDIPGFLSELDIYFQPSHYEGLCITVLEGMAAGLPIVGSDVGGISRTVEDGKSGYLFDSTNTEQFASAIRKLSQDSQLRAQFGKFGRETVVKGYTQEILVSEFEKAIEDS